MGIIIRQSIHNTLISYLGVALGFVTTILLYPQILTPEQYGLTRVMLSLSMIMTQFMGLGINNTIVRFFPYFRDKNRNHHGFLFFSILVPAVGFIFFGSLTIIFKDTILHYFIDQSELLLDYYWYLLPLAFFLLFFHVLNNFLRALYDTIIGSFLIQVLTRFLSIILLVMLALGWINFPQFMITFIGTYALSWAIIFIYTLTKKNISLQPDFSKFNSKLSGKMINYSFFAFMGEVASITVSNIDIIMLSILAGLDETGIYAIAFYIGSAIAIVRQSMYKISAPIISNAFKEEDYTLIDDVYKRSSLNLFIGGGLIFCGILVNLENIMSILPAEYMGGSLVVIVIAAANLFDMATGLCGAIILNSRHYRFDLYATLFLIIVTIVLNYLLIPAYGILGAAIGTATAIFLFNLVKVLFVWIHLNMQPFNPKIMIVIGIGAAILILNTQIPLIVNLYADLILRSTAVLLLFMVPITSLKISADINNLIESAVSKVFDIIRKF